MNRDLVLIDRYYAHRGTARHSANDSLAAIRIGVQPTSGNIVPLQSDALFHISGGTMADLVDVLNQLRAERKQAQLQIQKLNSAITALEGVVGRSNSTSSRNGAQPKRLVSAVARRRMARAQKARWAKARSKSLSAPVAVSKAPVKRTLSVQARRKIARAQRARWAQVRANQQKKAA